MPRSYDGVLIRRLKKGGVDKFWKAVLKGTTLTTTWGDMGTPGASSTKKYSSGWAAYVVMTKDHLDKVDRGYTSITAKELASAQKQAAAAGPPKSGASDRSASPEVPSAPKVTTVRKAKAPAKKQRR